MQKILSFPVLRTGNSELDSAFRIALGDIASSIHPWTPLDGGPSRLCMMAGLHYNHPWTRDAAYNTWYAGGLLIPDIARATLMAVITVDEYGRRVGGQYWDCIVWLQGAWSYYTQTGDESFLSEAFEIGLNTIAYLEATEQDEVDGLFRGSATFADGVAAFPDRYVMDDFSSGIFEWPARHPDQRAQKGFGLPMKAFSTNCLYYRGYYLLGEMGKCLNKKELSEAYFAKADSLRSTINELFWIEEKGHYRFFLDPWGGSDSVEGWGHGLAILFGIPDEWQRQKIFSSLHRTPHGLPALWPDYARYLDCKEVPRPRREDLPDMYLTESALAAMPVTGPHFGRHGGVIWPQVNSSWAVACAQNGQSAEALAEITLLATKACRDGRFVEIYHPLSGDIYGGVQEHFESKSIIIWPSCDRQTWCATGYLHMVWAGLFGLDFDADGLSCHPLMPEDTDEMSLEGLQYRGKRLDIHIRRTGQPTLSCNGSRCQDMRINHIPTIDRICIEATI